jgi:hypothetical protein
MIHKVGLLPLWNIQQVPFAYKMYTKADKVGWKQSNAFKKTFCIDVDIEFLGVWLVYLSPLHGYPSKVLRLFAFLTFYLFQGYCQLSWIDTTSTTIHDFQYRSMHI